MIIAESSKDINPGFIILQGSCKKYVLGRILQDCCKKCIFAQLRYAQSASLLYASWYVIIYCHISNDIIRLQVESKNSVMNSGFRKLVN